MRSTPERCKLVPGLFIAGEILDLDDPIGGYNFQAALALAGWPEARLVDGFVVITF